MSLRRYFQKACVVLSILVYLICYSSLYAQAFSPLQISEEDLKKAEAEIEAFRSSLSPEERSKFDNEVAELTKTLENMSDKELEDFFTQLATVDQEMGAQPPTEIPQPIIEPAPPLIPQPEPIKTEPAKKVDVLPAERLINSIITKINNFVLKTKTLQDFDRKIVSWQRESKLHKVGDIISWQDLQNTIHKFTQSLHKLIDKDPKTKEFRYLPDLIEDKKLYEKLSELNNELSNLEPNIIVSVTPGLPTINKNTKNLIRKVVDAITEIIFVDKAEENIKKIIEKYEPKAERLREHEEYKEQQARESSRYQRQPEAAKTVGKPPAERAPYTSPDYGANLGSRLGSAPSGYASAGRGYTPDLNSMADISAPIAQNAPTAPTISETSPKKSPEEAQPEQEQKVMAQPSKEATLETFRTIETVDTILKKMNKSAELIVENFKILDTSSISAQLAATAPDFGLVRRIVQIGQGFKKINDQLTTIKTALKDLPEKNRADIKKKLNALFELFTSEGKTFYGELRTLKIDEKDVWPKANTSDAVKYAYFADSSIKLSPELKALKEPANLIQIKKDFDEIIDKLQKLKS